MLLKGDTLFNLFVYFAKLTSHLSYIYFYNHKATFPQRNNYYYPSVNLAEKGNRFNITIERSNNKSDNSIQQTSFLMNYQRNCRGFFFHPGIFISSDGTYRLTASLRG